MKPQLIFDLTNNVTWQGKAHGDTLPCLLRGHRYWSSARQRPILGIELLRGQGFPASVCTSGQVKATHVVVKVALLRVFVFFHGPGPLKQGERARGGRDKSAHQLVALFEFYVISPNSTSNYAYPGRSSLGAGRGGWHS